jgi:hypothetical protein
MINPILYSSLFPTPKSEQELDAYIQSLPESQQSIAYKVSMMAFNLAHTLVEEQVSK